MSEPAVFAADIESGSTLRLVFTGAQVECAPSDAPAQPGLFLSPGWLDIQVNGFGGIDLNAPDLRPEGVQVITRRLQQEGVTGWCPTIITGPPERIRHSLEVIDRACREDEEVRRAVAGIHLEGPYLSPLEGARGAHPAQYIHPPDWDEFQRWQEAAGGRIRLVTMAPEVPGALALIHKLSASGVIPAIGHTLAGGALLTAGVDAGARLSTHLGNGIPAHLPRHPNPIWDQLAEDRLYASFIFDGFHLPPALMKTALRAKGILRSLLVSDATALAGLPPGDYDAPVGGRVRLTANGRLAMIGSDYLAGAACSLRRGVENAVRLAGCSLAQAVQMVTRNPASLLGFSGFDSATLFSHDPASGTLSVRAAIAGGRILYQSKDGDYG